MTGKRNRIVAALLCAAILLLIIVGLPRPRSARLAQFPTIITKIDEVTYKPDLKIVLDPNVTSLKLFNSDLIDLDKTSRDAEYLSKYADKEVSSSEEGSLLATKGSKDLKGKLFFLTKDGKVFLKDETKVEAKGKLILSLGTVGINLAEIKKLPSKIKKLASIDTKGKEHFLNLGEEDDFRAIGPITIVSYDENNRPLSAHEVKVDPKSTAQASISDGSKSSLQVQSVSSKTSVDANTSNTPISAGFLSVASGSSGNVGVTTSTESEGGGDNVDFGGGTSTSEGVSSAGSSDDGTSLNDLCCKSKKDEDEPNKNKSVSTCPGSKTIYYHILYTFYNNTPETTCPEGSEVFSCKDDEGVECTCKCIEAARDACKAACGGDEACKNVFGGCSSLNDESVCGFKVEPTPEPKNPVCCENVKGRTGYCDRGSGADCKSFLFTDREWSDTGECRRGFAKNANITTERSCTDDSTARCNKLCGGRQCLGASKPQQDGGYDANCPLIGEKP